MRHLPYPSRLLLSAFVTAALAIACSGKLVEGPSGEPGGGEKTPSSSSSGGPAGEKTPSSSSSGGPAASSTPGAPAPGNSASGGSSGGNPGDDPARCFIRASDYDQSCATDADCAFVPPGGNVCDPCSNGTGCLFCNLAAISAKAAPGYLATLQAALPAFDPALGGCTFGSCPATLETEAGTLPTPTCTAGRCTSSFVGCQ